MDIRKYTFLVCNVIPSNDYLYEIADSVLKRSSECSRDKRLNDFLILKPYIISLYKFRFWSQYRSLADSFVKGYINDKRYLCSLSQTVGCMGEYPKFVGRHKPYTQYKIQHIENGDISLGPYVYVQTW